MGTLALQGRDKLTLVTSPSLASFGLWAEQLVAESTGKESKGIVPVAGEPLLGPADYAEDRLFVYLRLEGDDNGGLDAAVEAIEAEGHPIVRLGLADPYDLGGEFFRWEFAVAVAGAVLGINPFDQPNVQQSKDLTARVLGEYHAQGCLPVVHAGTSLQELLAKAGAGDYLAVMAYVRPTPELERAACALREGVMKRHHIATTFGYGPRFLHSTGQLHKGGPDSGMFLQMVAPFEGDMEVPEAGYSFGTLAQAQALGDLQALTAMGRRVARVDLGADPVAWVLRLASTLG
jgi:glucose-6-phosphate isomerase/transaldolase/glucose-6-phosphate isomerase